MKNVLLDKKNEEDTRRGALCPESEH